MEEAIEIVLGTYASKDSNSPNDLVFSLSEEGSYVIDNETLEKSCQGEEETERTEGSLDDSESSQYRQRHGVSPLVAPISPKTESSGSSGEDPEDGEPSMVLALEDQDRQQRHQGRLGRTISTLRARATGYKHAPAVPCIESPEDRDSLDANDTQIQTVPFQSSVDQVYSNSHIAGRVGRTQASMQSASYETIPMGSPDPQDARKSILLTESPIAKDSTDHSFS